MRGVLALAAGLAVAAPQAVAAQGGDSTGAVASDTSAPEPGPPAAVLTAAAEQITAAEVARHLRALAADSLRGRTTPSPALEAAARYVAAEFRQLGLQPNRWDFGDTVWLKHYPLPGGRRQLAALASELRVAMRLRRTGRSTDAVDELGQPAERVTSLGFTTTARLAAGDSLAASTLYSYQLPLAGTARQPAAVLVVSGRHSVSTLSCERAERQLLLYVPPAGLDSAAQAAVLAHLTRCSPVVVLAAAETDSTVWAARQAAAADLRPAIFERYLEEAVGARAWAVYVAPAAVRSLLQMAGLDLAATWADTTPRVRPLPALRVGGYLNFPEPADTPSGVYVTGVLVGSDSVREPDGRNWLREASRYLVYSAALDGNADTTATAGVRTNVGNRAGAADPAGTEAVTEMNVAGLLALAKAFTQPGVRPRRSVMFLVTSGARQRAATSHLVGHEMDESGSYVNLTLEQIGRGRGDTLAIAGLREFRFARPPEWLAGAHPELGLTVVDGGTVLRPGSDAYGFAHNGWVSLALAPGRSDGAAEPPSAGGAGETEVARVVPTLRFAFYWGQELVNRRTRPQWTPEARNAWLRGLGH